MLSLQIILLLVLKFVFPSRSILAITHKGKENPVTFERRILVLVNSVLVHEPTSARRPSSTTDPVIGMIVSSILRGREVVFGHRV